LWKATLLLDARLNLQRTPVRDGTRASSSLAYASRTGSARTRHHA
jgi:hypothetical protein